MSNKIKLIQTLHCFCRECYWTLSAQSTSLEALSDKASSTETLAKEQAAEVVELKATVAELKTDNEGILSHSTISHAFLLDFMDQQIIVYLFALIVFLCNTIRTDPHTDMSS